MGKSYVRMWLCKIILLLRWKYLVIGLENYEDFHLKVQMNLTKVHNRSRLNTKQFSDKLKQYMYSGTDQLFGYEHFFYSLIAIWYNRISGNSFVILKLIHQDNCDCEIVCFLVLQGVTHKRNISVLEATKGHKWT